MTFCPYKRWETKDGSPHRLLCDAKCYAAVTVKGYLKLAIRMLEFIDVSPL